MNDINLNVVKSKAKQASGAAKGYIASFNRNYPRLYQFTIACTTLISVGLFYLDIYTDINATIAVAETGQHPWWTGRMITFLLLPLALTWIGMTLYVRQVVTDEKGSKGRWKKRMEYETRSLERDKKERARKRRAGDRKSSSLLLMARTAFMPVLLACLLVACCACACAGHVAGAGARVGGGNPMDGSPDQYGQGKTRRLASCGCTGSRSLASLFLFALGCIAARASFPSNRMIRVCCTVD